MVFFVVSEFVPIAAVTHFNLMVTGAVCGQQVECGCNALFRGALCARDRAWNEVTAAIPAAQAGGTSDSLVFFSSPQFKHI